MHGIIFRELKNFLSVQERFMNWEAFLKMTVGVKHYLPIQEYPDHEFMVMAQKAADNLDLEMHTFLVNFGRHMTPNLIAMYKSLISPAWTSLDLIEHIESTIHSIVRLKNPGAHPPALECRRMNFNEVTVIYNSPRKLCALAGGIMRGIADYFQDDLAVLESKCMHKGHHFCEIRVRRRMLTGPSS